MNIAEAKSIPLPDLVHRLGYEVAQTKKGGDELWYLSPLHTEKTPSFHVQVSKNIWYDFGTGKGGNILDFVMAYNHTDLRGALSFLHNLWGGGYIPSRNDAPISPAVPQKPSFIITEVQNLQHKALCQYLQERAILLDTARNFIQEVHYQKDDKSYFAIGIKNELDGWEIRNKYFKGCIGSKAFTIIESNTSSSTSLPLLVFEGLFDFLSYLTYRQTKELPFSVCILHSLALLPKLISLKPKSTGPLLSYFDNDKAGENARQLLTQHYGKNHIPMNSLYPGAKDFNEWLMHQ